MNTNHPTWPNYLWLILAAVGPLCMGNKGCEDQYIGTKRVCEYAGKSYATGDTFPSSDGCNTCSCAADSQVACTERACLDGGQDSGCEYGGKHYDAGQTFPAADGCNTCSCSASGSVECTERGCGDAGTRDGGCSGPGCNAGCEANGRRYKVGESFNASDGCNSCLCEANNLSTCTANFCEGTCKGGPVPFPAEGAWKKFVIRESWGPCAPGTVCGANLTLTPDRQIVAHRENRMENFTMSETDYCALAAILADPAFMTSMGSGFQCDEPPTDVFFAFHLEFESQVLKQTVTGCLIAGPQGNLAKAAYALVSGATN